MRYTTYILKTMQKIKFIVFSLALVFVSASFTQAQDLTVDEILSNYFENTGGLENWKSMKSMKMRGKAMQSGLEFPVTSYSAAPNKSKQVIEVQGKTIINACDGKEAWTVNPFAQLLEPTKLDGEQAQAMLDEEFESAFIDYKDKGHTVELEGTEEVDGTETYKIKLIKKNGDIEYHFFENEYFVPIMVRTFAKFGPQKGQATERYLSDYQEAGDLMMPYTITIKNNGQTFLTMVAEEFEVNAEIEDKEFAFPSE